ncbi:hypothetical protein AX16_000914 [Volvariella volvacea WC 439]|nr:hypothetical protein AX16_000914 [Volvariella volvacea WC 439]
MATASSSSWMPFRGKCPVQIGTSLTKSLNARSGNPAKSKFDRDFYAFKYNLKPPSIDTSKPGTLHVKQGQESTSVQVEYSSTQPGEIHPFSGSLVQAKEYECVLIYDEETGTCILEKLDSLITLQHERKKVQQTNPHVPTSTPALPAPSRPPISRDSKHAIDIADELEKELLKETEEDNDIEDIPRKEEEEEDEDEEMIPITVPALPVPPPQPPQPAPVQASKAKQRPAKNIPTAPQPASQIPAKRRPEAPTPTTSTAPQAKTLQPKTKKQKIEQPPAQLGPNEVEEEVLEFGKPTTWTTREVSKVAPASPTAGGLALPGSGAFMLPPAPTMPAKAIPPVPPAQPPPPTAAQAVSVDDESDVEWDPVPVESQVVGQIRMEEEEEDGDIFGDGYGDGDGEDGNFLDDAFEQSEGRSDEEEDEDFLEGAMSAAPVAAAPSRKPIPMRDLAGAGVGAADDSDDSDSDSSSEESSDEEY